MKKDRPVLRGAELQNTLMWANRILKRGEMPPGNFRYHAERVLDYLTWKKHRGVKFSHKRKENIKLIRKALHAERKLFWRYFFKRDIGK